MNLLKNKVEAILYGIGGKVSLDNIAKLCRSSESEVLESLKELQKEYSERETALLIIQDNKDWKLISKEQYSSIIRRIVSEVELPRSIMETLAIIAWKQPVLQSEVIKIRSASAYEHVSQLDKLGFLTKENFGRSYLLKTTDKFANYFELEGGKDLRKLLAQTREKHEKKLKRLQIRQEKLHEVKETYDPVRHEEFDHKEQLEEIESKLSESSERISTESELVKNLKQDNTEEAE